MTTEKDYSEMTKEELIEALKKEQRKKDLTTETKLCRASKIIF